MAGDPAPVRDWPPCDPSFACCSPSWSRAPSLSANVARVFVDARVDTVGTVDIDQPLAVPPLAGSTVDDDGTRASSKLDDAGGRDRLRVGRDHDDLGVRREPSRTILRAERGEQVRVEVDNRLPETGPFHWHGMHLQATMDGGPRHLVAPG